MALLDAISEGNQQSSIFRLGHAKLGLSAALIGSGMAFRYDLFRDTMADIKAVGGFDREFGADPALSRQAFLLSARNLCVR